MIGLSNQLSIFNTVEALYTHSIDSQTDDGDNIIFTIPNNNIKQYGRIVITGVIDGDGDNLTNYNQAFNVASVSGDDVTVLKAQDGFTLVYDATADFSGASITNLRVFDNVEDRQSSNDFPFCIVDIDDTQVELVGSRAFSEGETFFPILVVAKIEDFPSGNNVRVRGCRNFVEYKLQEILDEIDCKIVGGAIVRTETVWAGKKVCIIATTVEK